MDVLQVERLPRLVARGVLGLAKLEHDAALGAEAARRRRGATVAPDAVGGEDVQVGVAGLSRLQLDNQVLVLAPVGAVRVLPSHLPVLARLEAMVELVVFALSEERGVDELFSEGEEGGVHGEGLRQDVPQGVLVARLDADIALVQASHASVLDADCIVVAERVFRRCRHILGMSVHEDGLQAEGRVSACQDLDVLLLQHERLRRQHLAVVAREGVGEEGALGELPFGGEPVEVGIALAPLPRGEAEESEARSDEDSQAEAERRLASDGLVVLVVERIVELRLARSVGDGGAQIDDAVYVDRLHLFGRREVAMHAECVLTPDELLLSVLDANGKHGVGVLEDGDASVVALLQVRRVEAYGALRSGVVEGEDALGKHVAGLRQARDGLRSPQPQPSLTLEKAPRRIVGIVIPLPLHSDGEAAEIVVCG